MKINKENKMDIHMQNTILLKQNVAIARNYMVLSWYLDQFKVLELAYDKSRQDPTILNLILIQAKRRLNIKVNKTL
tara:strand:- start:72 stop:299 length:228 start_codon:yes stop_codon:yes gene_type:complete